MSRIVGRVICVIGTPKSGGRPVVVRAFKSDGDHNDITRASDEALAFERSEECVRRYDALGVCVSDVHEAVR